MYGFPVSNEITLDVIANRKQCRRFVNNQTCCGEFVVMSDLKPWIDENARPYWFHKCNKCGYGGPGQAYKMIYYPRPYPYFTTENGHNMISEKALVNASKAYHLRD